MSISFNSNDEISFFTPDSNAVNRMMDDKFIFNGKKGAVPNTKLIYEEDKAEIVNSPNINLKQKIRFGGYQDQLSSEDKKMPVVRQALNEIDWNNARNHNYFTTHADQNTRDFM